jgi:hypothetical protein
MPAATYRTAEECDKRLQSILRSGVPVCLQLLDVVLSDAAKDLLFGRQLR